MYHSTLGLVEPLETVAQRAEELARRRAGLAAAIAARNAALRHAREAGATWDQMMRAAGLTRRALAKALTYDSESSDL